MDPIFILVKVWFLQWTVEGALKAVLGVIVQVWALTNCPHFQSLFAYASIQVSKKQSLVLPFCTL